MQVDLADLEDYSPPPAPQAPPFVIYPLDASQTETQCRRWYINVEGHFSKTTWLRGGYADCPCAKNHLEEVDDQRQGRFYFQLKRAVCRRTPERMEINHCIKQRCCVDADLKLTK